MNKATTILIKQMLLFIFFFISINTVIFAETLLKENKLLSMPEIISKAAQKKVFITDWRIHEGQNKIEINSDKFNDQSSWIDFLTKKFQGSWAISRSPGKINFYLLPKGVNSAQIEAVKKFAQETNIKAMFENFQKANPIKEKNILTIPEIVALQALSEIEKTKKIDYQRMINPQSMGSAYSFKARYNETLDMIIPYEKNNLPVKNQMEGFSCFTSFYQFIMKNKNQLLGFRYKQWLYLTIKGDKSSKMLLSGDDNNLIISSLSRSSNSPKIDVYLSGNQSEFKSLGKIYHDGGILTISDIARVY
jgi:hypothetical protein